MTDALTWLGAAGGATVFIGGIWAVVRGIIKQTDATRANTTAINTLTLKMDGMAQQVSENAQKIARLEGRDRRRGM